MKVCKKCGVEKSLTEFGKEKRNRDGLNGTCKACDSAYKAQWVRENPERRAAALAKYESANQDRIRQSKSDHYARNRDATIARAAEWKARNKDVVSKGGAARYLKNRETILAHNKAWICAHPEAARAACHRRRARKLAAEGSYTADDVLRLFKLQRGCCAACGKPMKAYHIDHRVALTQGGSNDFANLQLLHPRCNQEKHTKDPIAYMQSLGFLL